ncbi:universal stress protein [bacterium]|nr:universal stress protein [bacterium]
MEPYQRILAAIDFSSHARLVVEHAAVLARELKAELIFINVINQRDIDAIYHSIDLLKNDFKKISSQRCIDQLHEERHKNMEELEKSTDLSTIKTRFIVRTGIPFQELLASVAEEKVEMLIMGIKGRSDLADVMVGSTALKMFKRCPVPLVTVRKNKPSEKQ